ncbi:MAG: universal stress protein [Rhodobacteraceae bacterium]|nr:universal stress protein [Paracoccaceae bacterium]
MGYKTIVTVVTDARIDKAALQAAIKISRNEGAHLDVLCLGIDRTQPGFYYAGANALIIQDNLIQAQADAEALEKHVESELDGLDMTWSTTAATVQMAGLTPFVAHRVRFADLVVLSKPYGEGRGHENEAIIEAALFNGHVPVVVVPDGMELPDSIGQAVIAWNESIEALAAIRAALPFLKMAERVNIAIIDPPTHGPDRSDPGGQLSQMLARHGVRAEVAVLAKTMPRVSDVLCRHCGDKDADLLVMGAYGHSRFRESILGGATRNMLENTEVPALLAH